MAKSEEKADVWMPLYVGDYLADTGRLTTEQHGAYLLLLMDYWRNGPPPNDEEVLRNITRLSKFLWKKHRPILEKFFTVEDGLWRQKRIDEEMGKAASNKAAAVGKARNAAKARWGKEDAPSIAQAMPEQCPSPSPSPLEKQGVTTDVGGTPVRPSELSAAMRRNSIEAQPGDPRIIAAAEAGISVETIEAACAEAKASDPTGRIKAGFVIAIAQRWTADAAKPRAVSRPRTQQRSYHDERAETIAGLTGRSRNHEHDDNIIDIPSAAVARLAG